MELNKNKIFVNISMLKSGEQFKTAKKYKKNDKIKALTIEKLCMSQGFEEAYKSYKSYKKFKIK